MLAGTGLTAVTLLYSCPSLPGVRVTVNMHHVPSTLRRWNPASSSCVKSRPRQDLRSMRRRAFSPRLTV
jgi:hypothetical protein